MIGVVRQREEIAVARKLRPDFGRQRQALLFRSQQDLRRAQRPAARITLRASIVNLSEEAAEAPAVNAPSACGEFSQPSHFGPCEDVRAVFRRDRQVVHRQRVFGPDIAAGHAIAAINTGFLRHAVFVHSVFEGLVVDSDVQSVGALAKLFGAAIQPMTLRRQESLSGSERGCGAAASVSMARS